MISWIRDFGETYRVQTGRYPMIYTTRSWWVQCTDDDGGFDEYPLVVARWASDPGELPGSWDVYSFWQKNNHYRFGGDESVWNGSEESLVRFAG